MKYVSTGMEAAFLLQSLLQTPATISPAISQEAVITHLRMIYNTSNKGDWEESDELSVSKRAKDIRDNGKILEIHDSVNDDGTDTNTARRMA